MVTSEKIKLSVAVAGRDALPSAFVVFRGFEDSIKKAADLGYDGIELALKAADEIEPMKLSKMLEKSNMEVSCISTGQVFADTGLMFTDSDAEKREKVKNIFIQFINLASGFGQKVNIGRVRGKIGNDGRELAEQRFINMVRDLCDYALSKDVTLILEPVNRYEIDFINTVEEGVQLIKKVASPNMKLMPDVFHMNIEDVSIGKELARHIKHIAYIHLADSNRLAPGWGHTDFDQIFTHLKNANYKGWLSVEILPQPEPYTAAKQAADYLKPYFEKYNNNII
jgi:5-keto-L-gluconate epimerase